MKTVQGNVQIGNVKGPMRYTAEQWEAVRGAVLGGMSMRAAARQFGMTFQAIGERARRDGWHVAEQRCIERGKAQLGRAGELRLKQALTVASVQEVKFEVEQVGEQLRKASLRAKAAMAEQIETVFAQLRESPGISAIERSRALRALASVCEVLYGWDKEPERESEEDPLACKGAINLPLMRMTPEQLCNAPFRSQMPEWWEEEGRRGIERATAQHGGNGSAGQEPVAGVSSQPVNQVEQTDVGMAALMRAFEQRRELPQAESRTWELEKAEAHGGKIWLPTDGKSKEEQLAQAGILKGPAERLRAARLARALPQEPAAVAVPELTAHLSPQERRQRELENLARERTKWREHRS